MAIRNLDWYNANAQRSWPFEELDSLRDDNGVKLPDNVIVDMHLRFPSEVGSRAYVSAITLSPAIITVLINSTDSGALLASLSVPRPAQLQRQYAVNPAIVGVGGWIVFGSAAADNLTTLRSWRFSEPEQSLLMAHTALAYTRLPVQSVGVHGVATRLRGRVRLQGGSDMETAKRRMTVNGVERDIAVIRLKDSSGDTTRRILEEYLGDCGKRPESRNCPNGTPIELVNTVSPDCCGRVYIELRGGLDVFPLANTNGVVLDLPIELDDACVSPARLPDERGRLPNEYQDQCQAGGAPTALALSGRYAMPSPEVEGSMFAFNGLLTVNKGNWSWQSVTGPAAHLITAYGISVLNYKQQLMLKTLHRHEVAETDTLILFTSEAQPALVLVTEVIDNNSFVVDLDFNGQHVTGWLNAADGACRSFGYEFYHVVAGQVRFATTGTADVEKLLLHEDNVVHYMPGEAVELPDGARGIAIWTPLVEIGVDDFIEYEVDSHSLVPVTGETSHGVTLRLPLLPRFEDITSSGQGTEVLVGPAVDLECTVSTAVTLSVNNPSQLYFAIVLTALQGDTITLEISQHAGGSRIRLLQKIGNSTLVRFTSKFDYDTSTDVTPLEFLLQLTEAEDSQLVSAAVVNATRGEAVFISPITLQGQWLPDSTVSLVARSTRATVHSFNLDQ